MEGQKMKSKLPEREVVKFVHMGVLSIDDNGDVTRHKVWCHNTWHDITPRKSHTVSGGYSQVVVSCKKRKITCQTSRLVWQYHNGDIPKELQINHKNCNKLDNRLSNLEVVTISENVKHAHQNNRWGEIIPGSTARNCRKCVYFSEGHGQTIETDSCPDECTVTDRGKWVNFPFKSTRCKHYKGRYIRYDERVCFALNCEKCGKFVPSKNVRGLVVDSELGAWDVEEAICDKCNRTALQQLR